METNSEPNVYTSSTSAVGRVKGNIVTKMILKEKYWHELFEFGVLLKGLNGLWETISGFLVLFLSKATFDLWFYILSRNELLEDPNDRLINFLAHGLQNISHDTKVFAAFYILAHGILNIFLSIQLYRDRHWAYLVTIGAMLVFMTYQVYRISVYHSLILTAITIFDGTFIMLAWHEYKYHKEQYNLKRM